MDAAETVDRVRTALESLGGDCSMEDVTKLCPELTWNQLFLAIDHMSRTGQVCISRIQAGPTGYRLWPSRSEPAQFNPTLSHEA
jgi:hypothetical protein